MQKARLDVYSGPFYSSKSIADTIKIKIPGAHILHCTSYLTFWYSCTQICIATSLIFYYLLLITNMSIMIEFLWKLFLFPSAMAVESFTVTAPDVQVGRFFLSKGKKYVHGFVCE